MKYFFVLGRNPELSIAEIRSYFSKNFIENSLILGNVFLISSNQKIDKEIVNELGGTIAIGEILAQGNFSNIKSQLNGKEIYSGTKNSFTYSVWNFSDIGSYEKVLGYLKIRFKDERLKAVFKTLTGTLNLQSGKSIKIPNSNLNEEYLFASHKNKLYFGKVTQRTNYEEIEKRDIKKPVRRESLAISPRLAKIMINLSNVKENEILVDPFCGIGSILQEALRRNIKVVGIDKDPEAIEGAEKNLEWAKFDRNKFSLIRSDSSKVNISNSNVLVTEPNLGEVLRKIPSEEKIKETMKKYENLIVRVLNNLRNKISGKILFTAPYMLKSKNKRIGCNIEEVLKRTNLKLKKDFPLSETRLGQIVGRQIFLLEK